MEIRKCYEILELRPGYSQEELKQSYKDLVQVWHPDRFAHNPRLKEKAEEKLKQINTAYEVLAQALRDRAQLNASRPAPPKREHSDIDLESIYQRVTWTASPTHTVRLKLKMFAWAMGIIFSPIALIISIYLLFQHFLVIVGIGLVVTGYFAVRWLIEQS